MEEVNYRLSEIFDALSNSVRIKVLELLQGSRLSVSELAENLNRSMNSVSSHLRVLRKHDLVQSETQAQYRIYFLKRPDLSEEILNLRSFLTRDSDQHE